MTDREAIAVLFGISYEEAARYEGCECDLTDEDYDEFERIKSHPAKHVFYNGIEFVQIDENS